MRLWATISARFSGAGKRGYAARYALTEAYRRLFAGQGSREDAEAVLADLANASGFYRFNGPGTPGDDRAFSDGSRAVFGRVFRFLRMTDDELRALENAARDEALVSAQYGEN